MKDSDMDIAAKRNEIKNLTTEMLRQMNEKEKDLAKKTERMNKMVSDAVDKTNEELSGVRIGIEQKFEGLYKIIEQKGEESLEKIKRRVQKKTDRKIKKQGNTITGLNVLGFFLFFMYTFIVGSSIFIRLMF